MQQYGLSLYDASTLIGSRELADYFEETLKASGGEAKLCANWVIGDLTGLLNKHNLEIGDSKISATQLAGMLRRLSDKTITGKIAKTVFEAMWKGEGDADSIIEKRGLKPITDSGAIEQLIDEIIAKNPKQVADYRAGKDKLFGFFVGQVMKASKGKANPAQVNELLKTKLNSN